MKQASLIVVVFLMLLSCQTGSISRKLTEVDSLVFKEEYDSAYQMISSIDETTIKNQEDQAHYNLLKVQTGYLANKPAASADSLLDKVIDHYQKEGNAEKLADAFYYKAIGFNTQKKYQESMACYKKAEYYANQSGNLYQQYKISEGISYVNGRCKNFSYQLEYTKKNLELARKLGKKNCMAYTYYQMDLAYYNLGYRDSAFECVYKLIPLLKYADKRDLPKLLSNVGIFLMKDNPQQAKEYFHKALLYREMTSAYENLASISYNEGNYEDAYQYWKKALTVNDGTRKDICILNLIEYNLERGRTDSISDMLTKVVDIRDSIETSQTNNAIKDLQTRFDHETAMHAKDQAIIRWQWGIMILALALLAGIGLYIRRR